MRMQWSRFWFAGLALAAGTATAQGGDECRKVIVSADPEFPPFAWYDGKTLRGASVDVVLTVLRGMKLPYELRYTGPFLRLLHSAEIGQVDIIAELKRTPEREAFLAFTETSIFQNPTSIFVRAGEGIRGFTGRESLHGLTGGVTRGTRFGGGLDEFVAEHLKVEEGPGIRENFSKLEAKRFDYFISPHYPAMTYLITSGQERHFEVLHPYVAEANVYVGWSRKSPCLGRLREFDGMLRHYLAVTKVATMVSASFDDWRRSPVMVR